MGSISQCIMPLVLGVDTHTDRQTHTHIHTDTQTQTHTYRHTQRNNFKKAGTYRPVVGAWLV